MKIKEKLSKSIQSERKRENESKNKKKEKKEGREDWGPHAREARGGPRGPLSLPSLFPSDCIDLLSFLSFSLRIVLIYSVFL